MKLIEVLVMIILLPLFSMTISSNMKAVMESRKRFSEKNAIFCTDKSISSSFIKICEKNGGKEAEMDSFLRNCNLLFELDSIKVETVGVKDRKKLMKCEWRLGTRSNFVLAVTEK
ncbi:hypothetical protein [uncultured Treponema sp.]|uniref:hypothetical protein n=1 Tax=uncultured Treponema sp. TaxID=162155 RepID=UPI0025EAFEC5|nr:hypothetical protein [uncultured Treponema sp.]